MSHGASVTWEEALSRLKEGNARFVAGRSQHPHADEARRAETAERGQHPFAAVVGCSDSRAPVEIIFDQGIGDLFVVRVPGNVCNGDEIGAVEYAVEHLDVQLCVVLGHTRCGAVISAVTGASLTGHLARLLANIRLSIPRARKEHPSADEQDLIEAVARTNVRQSIADLSQGSPLLRERVEEGTLKVMGAVYDVASGAVQWMEG
jgi:carbonic anhydrase